MLYGANFVVNASVRKFRTHSQRHKLESNPSSSQDVLSLKLASKTPRDSRWPPRNGRGKFLIFRACPQSLGSRGKRTMSQGSINVRKHFIEEAKNATLVQDIRQALE